MNETKHTPGPWWVSVPPSACLTTRFIEARDGTHICKVGHRDFTSGSQESDLANAYLIAAAPELLEALECLLARCKGLDLSATHDGLTNCNAKAQARAAIAKATETTEGDKTQ